MRNNKRLAILVLFIGILGLIATGYFIISSYLKAKNIEALLIPVAIGFIPFFVSFVLLRLGINGLISNK